MSTFFFFKYSFENLIFIKAEHYIKYICFLKQNKLLKINSFVSQKKKKKSFKHNPSECMQSINLKLIRVNYYYDFILPYFILGFNI